MVSPGNVVFMHNDTTHNTSATDAFWLSGAADVTVSANYGHIQLRYDANNSRWVQFG